MRAALALALAAQSGCVAMVGGIPDDSDLAVVEAAWQAVDALYPMFEEKGVDWDAAGREATAEAEGSQDEHQLFDIVAAMLDHLEDGHVNLVAPFETSVHRGWLDAPDAWDEALTERILVAGGAQIIGPLVVATLPGPEGEVGVLRVASFQVGASPEQLDAALARVEGTQRLVIDLRSNGGGDLDAARALAARFLDEERVLYQRQARDGEGLGAPQPQRGGPQGQPYPGEVVMLTDARTYSAANTFVAMMKAAGHWQLGLATGGGAGVPAWRELPNGWRLRVPSLRLLDAAGASLEPGLAPELEVLPDAEAEAEGVDVLLEAALFEPRPR